MLPLKAALVATFCSGLAVFLCRAFPFLVFTKRKPPRILSFIEQYLPPMVMAILLVYCFRSTDFTTPPFGLPGMAALALTTVLHLWKGNPMVSILSGTILYMILIRVM